MSGWIDWHGYLVKQYGDSYIISSSQKSGQKIVFGYDSNHTTLAISLIRYLQFQGKSFSFNNFVQNLDEQTIIAATGINNSGQTMNLLCHNEALVAVTNLATFPEFDPPNKLTQINPITYQKINDAWELECNRMNTSQGAYISEQQYSQSLNSRLSLQAQAEEKLIWPPRKLTELGKAISAPNYALLPTGKILTWTTLSATGAPSEFAIRAPILGGLSTVMVQLNEGPTGVFLVVDDEQKQLVIDNDVELIVRMLYGQEGKIRYGLKARIL